VLRRRVIACWSLWLATGCYAPVLTTRAVGCYAVEAPAWTPARASEYGFAFPEGIELDSAFAAESPDGRRGWPWNDEMRVVWDNTASDWLMLPGDTIIGLPLGPAFHTMQQDSIRVSFRSRRDGFQAWLAPFTAGYRGVAQRVDWKTGRRESIFIELRRTRCSDAGAS
jgi:hypothetical protein